MRIQANCLFEPSIMQSIEKFSISYEHATALYDAKPAGDVFLFYSVMVGEFKIYYRKRSNSGDEQF